MKLDAQICLSNLYLNINRVISLWGYIQIKPPIAQKHSAQVYPKGYQSNPSSPFRSSNSTTGSNTALECLQLAASLVLE